MMTNTPSETEIDNLLCKHWPAYSMQAVLVKMWLREAIKSAIAKWAAPQPQAGAVPQGWKAVPVNPTPEMWKAAKTVPDPNPPYPPHYGLVWDAMLAASPTPTAEQLSANKAAPGEPSDVEIDDFLDSPACITWVIASNRDRYRLLVRAVLAKWAAPQQEAQEPAFWMNEKGHTDTSKPAGGWGFMNHTHRQKDPS